MACKGEGQYRLPKAYSRPSLYAIIPTLVARKYNGCMTVKVCSKLLESHPSEGSEY
jgi:hypothetical protein